MIGFFDSGFGGLTILKEVEKIMPEYSYIYLGDNARAPYGSRTAGEIYQFTTQGVGLLFEQGAELVVLACNTASAVALKRLQQEWLPRYYPRKKVLGIIIPTAEAVDSFSKTGRIGILATEATTVSGVYEKEIRKINEGIKTYLQVCPLFVPAIEAGEHFNEAFAQVIKNYLVALLQQERQIDAVILGCTHYALVSNEIKKQLPGNIRLITQGELVAKKLKNYLKQHPEINHKLKKQGRRTFLTTKTSAEIESLATIFYGQLIKFKEVKFKS